MIPSPQITIIGAGPGDPELITVRGQKLLSHGDVVFYTGSLVPQEMLSLCRPEAELIDTRSMVLESVLPTMIERARAGKQVVRLQDGDPCLYGALHEMMVRLLQAGIEVEIVPGVSAFQLAAARLKVELTVPEVVQTIILTRASGRTQVPPSEELSSLAAHRASLCLYLSGRHAATAQAQLLAHYPDDTPVALCYRLGWPDEEIQIGPLAEMTQLTRSINKHRTLLYVISPALGATGPHRSNLYAPEHKHRFRPRLSQQPIRQSTV